MLEIAGGILIALVAIVAALIVLGSGLWRFLFLVAYVVVIGVAATVALAIIGVAPVEVARGVLFLVAVGGAAALCCVGLLRVQEYAGGSFVGALKERLMPVGDPSDPRHPEHLQWANRRGDYAER